MSITNHTQTDPVVNLGLHGERPATNSLNNGTGHYHTQVSFTFTHFKLHFIERPKWTFARILEILQHIFVELGNTTALPSQKYYHV
jgi:hypothetical protein